MRSPRFIRTVAVVSMSALVLGAFVAAPADAKKKKKKKKAAACAAFQPGEAGAGKPTVVLKDTATEAAPVAQKVTVAESIADLDQTGRVSHAGVDAFNIQVDSAAKEAGLYALVEFQPRNDIDLNLLHTDGSYAARSRSFNTIQETTDQGPYHISTQGHGGEGTDHSEKLVGIRTSDCGGWTLEVQNWLGMGGELEIKLWLGEIKNDPLAPGEETP